MWEQKQCLHHAQPITYVCTSDQCKNKRPMCDLCRTKEAIHFSQHGNFIYKLKDFEDVLNTKGIMPRLQNGVKDSENYVKDHKAYYKREIQVINCDFDQIMAYFLSLNDEYRKTFVSPFEQEMNSFDSELNAMRTLLQDYVNESEQQQGFFSKLFNLQNNSHSSFEQAVQKHSKAFKVRAAILNFRSTIQKSKQSKTLYKPTATEEGKFKEIKDKFGADVGVFFKKFQELLVSPSNQNSALKSSIVSETKSLTASRVSHRIFSENDLSKSFVAERPMGKVPMPQLPQQILKKLGSMEPLPLPKLQQEVEGPFQYSNGIFLGHYKKGVRHGYGTFIFDKDRAIYEGTWENDRMSGYGRLVNIKSIYVGNLSNGAAHGKGAYEDQNKIYKGDWVNDKRHGVGTEQWKITKLRYTGHFVCDKYEGKGKLVEEESTYEGNFKEGKMEGEGVLHYNNGQTFEGLFKAGLKDQGRFTLVDGSFYEGRYRDNLPHGYGQFYWADGVTYKGEWSNGLQEGLGIEIFQDKRELKGQWAGGRWVKWI